MKTHFCVLGFSFVAFLTIPVHAQNANANSGQNGQAAPATTNGQVQNQEAASIAQERARLQQKMEDIQDRIDNLQSDADQNDSAAEQDDEQAENLQSSGNNCTGAAAAACDAIGQFGVNKFRSNARDERRQASSDREEIGQLQNKLAEMQARLNALPSSN